MRRYMKIVVLDAYTLNPGERRWEELEELGEVIVHDRTSPQDVVRRAEDADVVLTNKTVLDRLVLDLLPKLKYIGVLATGYNVVDLDAARQRGIVVTNIPAYSTMSVAQMVIAHLLNITQRVDHYAREVHNGVWSAQLDFCYWNTPLIELAGKKMGIVGFGNTGQATARIAEALGMDILLYTSKPKKMLPKRYQKVTLNELFSMSDVVSLHCPLTSENKEMVNSFRLSLMKQGGYSDQYQSWWTDRREGIGTGFAERKAVGCGTGCTFVGTGFSRQSVAEVDKLFHYSPYCMGYP